MDRKLKWYSFRWRFLVLFFVLCVWAIGYGVLRIYLITRVLPMGVGPAGPSVAVAPFDGVWSLDKYILVGLGDSITRGLGTSRPYTYFQLLAQNDNEQYPEMAGCDLASVLPNLEFKNYAQDFTVTQQHIDVQLPRVAVYPADVRGIVVLTTGGNDLIHDYGRSKPCDGAMYGCSYRQAIVWTENIKQRIGQILNEINRKFPGGCDIFLANIFDPTDGISDPQIVGLPRWSQACRVLALTNEKIVELCNEFENVHLIDIHSTFLGHGIHCTERWRKYYHQDDPTFWYYHNLEDPNQRGYDAIRRLYITEIAKVLSRH